ncbi:MAG: hypothetical protein ACJAZN_003682 [Planctomycetota bacterium]|jgi:hypothetical protein
MITTYASLLGALLFIPGGQPGFSPPDLTGPGNSGPGIAGPGITEPGITVEDEGETQLMSRTFDLSALSMATSHGAYSDRWTPMLPLVRGMGSAFERSSTPGEIWMAEDNLAERVVDNFLMNDDKGVETCELTDDGQLYLEAPASVIQNFERLLRDLEAQVLARPRLEIRRFTVRSDSMSAPHKGGLVPRGSFDDWLSGGEPVPIVTNETRRSVTMPEGRLHLTSDLQSHTIMAGINVEIAEAVASVLPAVREAAVGSEIALSGFRLGNEVQLQYSVMQTKRRDRQGLEASIEWLMTGDDGRIHRDDSRRWVEPFGVTGGTVAGEARLTLGSYLVLAVGAAEGHVSYVVIGLDPASVASAPMASRDAGDGNSWFVAPQGLVDPMVLDCDWLNVHFEGDDPLNRTLESPAGDALTGEAGGLGVYFRQENRSMFGRLLETIEIQEEVDIGGKLMIVHATGDKDAVTRFAAAEIANRRGLLHVNVGTIDHNGAETFRGALTVLDGGQGAITSGDEVLLAKFIETEVAQHSSAQTPVACTHFEGLALSLELKRVAGSKLAYRLIGQLATDQDISGGSANFAAPGGLSATTTSHLMIDESGLVAVNADGTWTIVAGELSAEGARVELTVTTD